MKSFGMPVSFSLILPKSSSSKGVPMSSPSGGPPADQRPPLGQRLLDNPFLLLVAGLVVMLVIYTAWGLWEVLSLPTATLP